MMHNNQTLILIGFKCVGKTAIGQALSRKLHLPFYDLDDMIEQAYHQNMGESLNCRQIFKKSGIEYFRQLESIVLKQSLSVGQCVLSVGGGTPLTAENQLHIARGHVIHIQAPKGLVFERIMITGRPAFFPEGEEAYEAFLRIWEERAPIYQQLADQLVMNTGTIETAVAHITSQLFEEIMT
jgi:shikimate kinase